MRLNLLIILIITVLNVIFTKKKVGISENNKFSKNCFLFLSLFLLFAIVVSRKYYIGNDTLEYLRIFKKCAVLKWKSFSAFSSFEKGYIFLNIIISYVSDNSRFFLVFMGALFYTYMYKFIKNNSSNYYFSLILFITLLFFYNSMSMMRQILAIAIIANGYEYIKKKNFTKYTITVLFAMLFHKTAIIALLLYPLYNIKYTKKRTIFILIMGIISFIFLQNIFGVFSTFLNKTTSYLDNLNSFKTANIIYSLIYFVLFIFARLITKNNDCNDKEKSFYLYTLLFTFMLNALSIKLSILSRLSMYFSIYIIIILPNIIQKEFRDKNLRFTISSIICLLFIVYSCVIIYSRPEWNSAFNYETCIRNSKSNGCN